MAITKTFQLLALFCVVTSFSLPACTPVRATRGNYLEEDRLQALQLGVSTKAEVEQKLGSPTTIDPFNKNKWFYIGEKTSRKAFFDAKIDSRRVYALTFNDQELLADAKQVDEKNGKEIDIVKKATPAPGREMNAFEQFVSNLGKFNQSGMSNAGPQQGR